MLKNKKHLGQHWLRDRFILNHIADCADINKNDTIVEIGPGLGTLTSILLFRAKEVISIEFDADLARKLPGQFPGKDLTVINQDILEFDTDNLPKEYKLVANLPYYITAKVIQKFTTSKNRPSKMVLLVQKEVAERVVAQPGRMSLLSVSSQLYANVSLGDVVPACYFTPPPKVDSQVLIFDMIDPKLPSDISEKELFRIVKAGFSSRRKKLRSSLSGGLNINKNSVETLLMQTGISPDHRAEDLSVEDWKAIAKNFYNCK